MNQSLIKKKTKNKVHESEIIILSSPPVKWMNRKFIGTSWIQVCDCTHLLTDIWHIETISIGLHRNH